MNEERILSDILSENWLHVRHIESERRQFMYIYSVLIGAILTILGSGIFTALESSGFTILLVLFLTLLSLLGLLWTLKANIEIHNLFDKIGIIALCLDVRDKVGLPVQHRISIGELFETFYSLMLAFWITALVYLILRYCTEFSNKLCYNILCFSMVLYFIVFFLVHLHVKKLKMIDKKSKKLDTS